MAASKQIKRGKVLVFNTEVNRVGTQSDVDILESTFKLLNADVEICDSSRTKDRMKEVQKSDLSEYDYIAIVWGSHGTEDDIGMTADQKYIYIRRALLTPLCKNRTLSNKLKWIITQTCRGDLKIESGAIASGEDFYDPKYYLISSSTTDGSKSWRLLNGSSIFIPILCKRIREHYNDLDILSILKEVRRDVQNEFKKFKGVENTKYEIDCNRCCCFPFCKSCDLVQVYKPNHI